MHRFTHVTAVEGGKKGICINIPSSLGVPAGAYAAIVNGTSFVGFVRTMPSRSRYPAMTLPRWAFPKVAAGVPVEVTLAPAQRAAGSVTGFDWLRFVPERCFPTQEGDDLVLHSAYEPPFRLRRTPADLVAHYRLLGYYQAEGSKAESGADWSFATSLLELSAAAVKLLGMWGLPPPRLYTEVLYGHGKSPEEACAYFAPLGLEVAATRVRPPGRGAHAVVVHIRSSSLIRAMTIAAIQALAVEGFPSVETAQAYAFGWLDGDGAVTVEKTGSIRLGLFGYEYEHKIMQEAFHVAFGWAPRGRWRNLNDGTPIYLKLSEAAQLLEAGVFPYSMARARLLLAFDARTAALRRLAAQAAPFRLSPQTMTLARQGLVEQAPRFGYQITSIGHEVLAAHVRLIEEINWVRAHADVPNKGITNKKGVAYPAFGRLA